MSGAPVLDKVTVNGPDGEFLLFCTTLVRWSPRRGTGGRGSRIKVCTGDRWQPATRSVLSYQSARTIKEGLVQNIPSSNDSAALRPDRWCSDGAAYSGSRLFASCPRDGRGVHCPSSYYRCVRTEGLTVGWWQQIAEINLVQQTFRAHVFVEASWGDAELKQRRFMNAKGSKYPEGDVIPKLTPSEDCTMAMFKVDQIGDKWFFAPRVCHVDPSRMSSQCVCISWHSRTCEKTWSKR